MARSSSPSAKPVDATPPEAPDVGPSVALIGAPAIVTMRDVAKATGVSQSTVSRVLSGAPTVVPIAPETRERVVAAARRLGYRPNPLARGLRGARTMLLGVIVREITDPFFAGAVDAVSTEASRRGYNVVLGTAHAQADEAIALWTILEARHCDAIVLLGDMRDQPRVIDDLRNAQVPVVALWEGSRPSGIASVSVDNGHGITAVMSHLSDLGHRRIAFVGGRRLGDIAEREAAYVEAVARSGEPPRPDYVRTTENSPDRRAAGAACAARTERATDGRRFCHRCSGDRRASRSTSTSRADPRRSVDRRVRRHHACRLHGPGAHHGAHARERDGRQWPWPWSSTIEMSSNGARAIRCYSPRWSCATRPPRRVRRCPRMH